VKTNQLKFRDFQRTLLPVHEETKHRSPPYSSFSTHTHTHINVNQVQHCCSYSWKTQDKDQIVAHPPRHPNLHPPPHDRILSFNSEKGVYKSHTLQTHTGVSMLELKDKHEEMCHSTGCVARLISCFTTFNSNRYVTHLMFIMGMSYVPICHFFVCFFFFTWKMLIYGMNVCYFLITYSTCF